jgi:hypothetical protein
MSSYNPLFAPWLFEIGQKLRVAYDDIADLCFRISLRFSKCLKSPLRRPANNPPDGCVGFRLDASAAAACSTV